MAEAYEHLQPNARVIDFALVRKEEIKEEIGKLQSENKMWDHILKRFRKLVCSDCDGEGYVMRPIPGCEIDGPRMHKCDKCGGTGEPK